MTALRLGDDKAASFGINVRSLRFQTLIMVSLLASFPVAFVGGQVVAVVGPNAAGKSSLFKRMAGLIEGPGQMLLQGSKKGPQGISYMPQGLSASALDMHRQVQVLGFMRALARKREVIVFIATHDLNQALRFADQVLVIADGTAQGSGPSAEVITEPMLRKVYKVEARIERCSRGQHHILIDDIV